jgi:CRISPR/Cas system CSM-associated protein Csm2 small subunit
MKKKPYWEMSAKELAEATKQFDEPLVVDRSRPLNATEREQWKRVKRKRGRPKVGRGHQRVSISVEKGLLKRITAYAKQRRMTRSGLVAEVFEELLAKEK